MKVEVCVSLCETVICVAFTPWAVYAVDSVLVKAGMLRNSVTVTGPPVAEGAAATVSEELEESVEEAEAAAAAVEAGEVEEEDMEDAVLLLSCRRSRGPAIASFANPRALL